MLSDNLETVVRSDPLYVGEEGSIRFDSSPVGLFRDRTGDDDSVWYRNGWEAGFENARAQVEELDAADARRLAPRRVHPGWLPLVAAIALAAGVWIGRAW